MTTDLYQQIILEHSRNPRFLGVLTDAHTQAEEYNRLCGDRITVFVRMRGDVIEQAQFTGSACAIAKSSASLMMTLLQGKTIQEAMDLYNKFQEFLTQKTVNEQTNKTLELGELRALAGVREFPSRIKCALLPWKAMAKAVHPEGKC